MRKFRSYVACLAAGALLASVGCQPPSPPPPSPKTPTPSASSGSSTTGAAPKAEKPAAETAKETDASSETPAEPAAPSGDKPTDKPAEPPPAPSAGTESKSSIQKMPFGKTADGREVSLYTLANANGLVVKMSDYGATVVSVETPDRDGKLANITLGFPTLEGYLQRHPYFGSTVGRYGNRIAGGKFSLDGQEFTLAANNGPNHLHGGLKGFDAQVWKAEEVKNADGVGIKFTLRSPDGDEGYPGALDVVTTYTLTNANELRIDYEAKTDKPTVVNLTNHCYWNLSGAGGGKILDHELTVTADSYLPIDATSIPLGDPAPVAGTPFDFTKAEKIGARVEQLKIDPHTTKGYDHCFVLRAQKGELELAARVKDAKTGRVMEILTTEPGIQFYTGNFLDGSEGGNKYEQHDAFCLETQRYPDSPNKPAYPTSRLNPDQTYKSTTVHRFSVEK